MKRIFKLVKRIRKIRLNNQTSIIRRNTCQLVRAIRNKINLQLFKAKKY